MSFLYLVEYISNSTDFWFGLLCFFFFLVLLPLETSHTVIVFFFFLVLLPLETSHTFSLSLPSPFSLSFFSLLFDQTQSSFMAMASPSSIDAGAFSRSFFLIQIMVFSSQTSRLITMANRSKISSRRMERLRGRSQAQGPGQLRIWCFPFNP